MRDIFRNNVIMRNITRGRYVVNSDYRWQPIENDFVVVNYLYLDIEE